MNSRLAVFLFGALLCIGPVVASQWPDDPDRLTTAFGFAETGHFLSGLRFRSDGQRISVWDDGEIIWSPSGRSGSLSDENLIVIQHDGGFRTSYRGIDIRPDLPDSLPAGEWIGYAANDSWMFEIRDSRRARIVNPLNLLPPRSGIPPSVPDVLELTGASGRVVVSEGVQVQPGVWDVHIRGLGTADRRAVPLEISLFWVGVGIGQLRFDGILESATGLVMESPEMKEFNQLFDFEGDLLIPSVNLNAGKGQLEIRLRDETGRVTARSWTINVVR